MALPIVAIIGRPNVGKSTLANRIAQAQDAIVHKTSGVTRDRSYHRADWNGRDFMIVDTGGIEMGSPRDAFQSSINEQVDMAAHEADCIIFLVDGREQLTSSDQDVARMLRRLDVPVFLAVNKIDDPTRDEAIWELYNLGLGQPYPLSALHGTGTGDLLDDCVKALPEERGQDDPSDISLAIIGRPNAGKSSLTNALIGKTRSIVSDVAGTTRDAIDTILERDGRTYNIVDTAGIRRKGQMKGEDIEYYGFLRALRAIERCDVALLVIDAPLGVTDQDQHVASIAEEKGCALMLLLNKWDLVKTEGQRKAVEGEIEDKLGFVSYAPVLRISALTGRGIGRIWDRVWEVYQRSSAQIPTNRLNSVLADIRDFGHTVVHGTRRLRLHYVTQTGVRPPVFTFFANSPDLVDDPYRRYLENRLRENFDLAGTPVRIKFRKKA